MKYATNIFLAVAALFVVTAASAVAQTASASVTSTATIVTPLTAAATAPLAFGTITKGSTATIGADGAAAGGFSFSGDEADNITISIPSTLAISTTSGAGASMTVTLNRSGLRKHTASAQGSSTALDASSGSATTALSTDASGDGVNNDGLGQLYLWIGGAVTPTATQQRGNYTGTFTVSAAYSN
jgi:hypothetical protein